MPVTLQNRLRQMQVFNLDHAAYCQSGCGCIDMVVTVSTEHPRTGARLPRRVEKKVPQSLTLLALERRADLPDAILNVAEVKSAIGAGSVRVLEQTLAVNATTSDSAPKSPSVSDSAPPPRPASQGAQPTNATTAAAAPASVQGSKA